MDKLKNKEIINFGKDPLGKFAQQDKSKQEKTKINFSNFPRSHVKSILTLICQVRFLSI